MSEGHFACDRCRLAHPADCMAAGYCEHRDPLECAALYALAERVAATHAADRDLDAQIAETAFGWKPGPVSADADGKNAGTILTPDGGPFMQDGRPWAYPPKGAIHRAYHCPAFTRDCLDPALPRGLIRQQTAQNIRAIAARKSRGH